MDNQLATDHARIRAQATALAGKPGDLIQRSCVYHHLYQHSAGNHAFPLLAAHGALWGSGHFRRGAAIGKAMSVLDSLSPDRRRHRLAALDTFAESFREINRRVCVETYTFYHLSALHGDTAGIDTFVPCDILAVLNACHAARHSGVPLDPAVKYHLFRTFFGWEQDNVVGPSVDAAIAALDWPAVKWMALKPPIGFHYFGPAQWLWFRNFGDKAERIKRGEQAYAIAAQKGWDHVVEALANYGIMPATFVQSPARYFDAVFAQTCSQLAFAAK